MTALLSSLKRIWSAKNRVPHQTEWGTFGSLPAEKIGPSCEAPLLHRLAEQWLELTHLARRTAPAIVVVILNIFR